jgi:hypothetical protein
MKRSGLSLVIAGVLGIAFFLATDPHFDIIRWWRSSSGVVDAAHQALAGTVVGLAGSLVVLCVGLWLLSRR